MQVHTKDSFEDETLPNIIHSKRESIQLVDAVQSTLERQYIVLSTTPPSFGEKQLDAKRLHLWTAALHHLLQLEWNGKHKFPKGFKGWIKLSQPFGRFLQQTFFLCEKCHGRQEALQYRLKPNDAGEWFQLIFNEIFYEGGILTLLPKDLEKVKNQALARGHEKKLVNKHDEKRTLIRRFEEYCKTAASLENPYKESGRMKHFAALLDAAIELSQGEGNQFKKNHYGPFIESWQNVINILDTPDFQRHEVINGNLVSQMRGPGKATKINIRRSGSQKPLFGKGSRSYSQTPSGLGFSRSNVLR